jgi:hypothetical protein
MPGIDLTVIERKKESLRQDEMHDDQDEKHLPAVQHYTRAREGWPTDYGAFLILDRHPASPSIVCKDEG